MWYFVSIRYASANNSAKAIQTFNFMDKFRLTPDQEAFHALLTALSKYGNVEEAEEFMLVNKKLFPLNTESFNIILNGWCNITKDIYEAKKSLERNVEILYNTKCYFI